MIGGMPFVTPFMREMALMAALVAFFFGSLGWAIRGEALDRRAERRAAFAWYRAHPPAPAEAAANRHFRLCDRYRREPDEARRSALMAAERCHRRDRDDPRRGEATFPWNGDAPRPWREAGTPP
jgi:hypothetical protein